MKKQVERYGTSEHLRQVAGADGDFAHQPVGPTRPLGIPVAAALSEILPRHYTEPGRDNLHEDRHQAGKSDHP